MAEQYPDVSRTPEWSSSEQEKWLYGYRPTAAGIESHPVRRLTEDEYDTAGRAVKAILDVLTGPTSFSELARRDLARTIDDVCELLSEDLRKIEEWGPQIEYRIVAVSAALRMHEEFVYAVIGKRKDEESSDAAREIFNATYDGSQPYRIIYALRNALVHGSRSLTSLRATGTLNADDTISNAVFITLNRESFANSDAKGSIRSEVRAMDEDPDLVELSNRALDDVAAMRNRLEPLLYPEAPAAVALLFAYAREVRAAELSGPHFHSHDPGNPFGNLTQIAMNESVFNHVIRVATGSN